MAQFMLDTNICIYLMKNQPPVVSERLDQCMNGDVVILAITFAELEYGALTSANPLAHRRNLASIIQSLPVVAFDADSAIDYAPIRQATHHRKRHQLDKLIAAHTIALGLTLVTNNIKDFARTRAGEQKTGCKRLPGNQRESASSLPAIKKLFNSDGVNRTQFKNSIKINALQ